MKHTLKLATISAVLAAAFTLPLHAGDVPRNVWAQVKCAVCHGADGSGNTPQGKSLGTPDLRSEKTQTRTTSELTAIIQDGTGKMPGFRRQLSLQQLALVLYYVRNLPGAPAPQSQSPASR